MDAEGKFPQKKYTYRKDLSESILYGNRNIYDELKEKIPFISKETFQSMFSEQDMASVIAGASGTEAISKTYGNNTFYETIKTQNVTQEDGTVTEIKSIIDMCFEDSYIHSFSFSYTDSTDGIDDYNKMLASFEIGKKEEVKYNREYYLQKEREAAKKNQATEVVNVTEAPKPTATVEPQITEEPQVTNEPVITQEPITSEEPIVTQEPIATEIPTATEEPKDNSNSLSGEKFVAEKSVDSEDSGEVKEIVKTQEKSGENRIEEITISISNVKKKDNTIENQEQTISIKPQEYKKTNMFFAILSLPIVRNLIIFCIIFDIIITILVKRHKKKKKLEKESENSKEKEAETNKEDENKY
jgi:hypothetical protein